MSLIKNILFIFIFSVTALVSAEPTRIMLLGDSITYDYAFSDNINPRSTTIRSGYRNYLWYKLEDANYNVDFVGSLVAGTAIVPSFDPDNEGYPGATSTQIADITYAKLVANPADIVLLHIGTNDWSESTSGLNSILEEIDRYEHDYDHKVKVVLARIINSPYYLSSISNYNHNLQSLANSRITAGDDIVVVDMEYGAGINYATDFQDSFHPNNTGYYKMATVWFNSLNTILPTLLPPNPLIKPFVEHFYTKILLREGEEQGITYWSEGLATYKLTAADLARGFIFSDEFENQSTDDITFLEILYSAFFDRVSDSSGLTYWEDQLNQGKSRFTVLNGFLYSQEFNSLAQSYNILAVDPSEFFVTRFYTKVLERDPEQDGFTDWVSKLRAQHVTAKDIARAFFFSEEFLNKDVDDITYLTLLYRTLLDREPDVSGLNTWLLKLDEGQSRYEILDSFIYSPEFKNLAEIYNVRL